VSQVERQPLDRFLAAVEGRGRVRGPYAVKNERGQPCHEWVAYSREAEEALDLLWPFLSDPKRLQALEAQQKLDQEKQVVKDRREAALGPGRQRMSRAAA
jgi:hypothetical protein